jgi:hypothetical protein
MFKIQNIVKSRGSWIWSKLPKQAWGFTTFMEVAGETWHILSSPCLQKTDWQLIFPPSVHNLQKCVSRKETAQVDKQIWQGKKRKKKKIYDSKSLTDHCSNAHLRRLASLRNSARYSSRLECIQSRLSTISSLLSSPVNQQETQSEKSVSCYTTDCRMNKNMDKE